MSRRTALSAVERDRLRIVLPVEDGLHDGWREQGEPEHPGQVGRIDPLGPGDRSSMVAKVPLSSIALPAMRANGGLDQRAVNPSRSRYKRRPRPALGRYDLLSAASPAEGERPGRLVTRE